MTHHHHHRRRVSTCHRHPAATPVTGFCASCLRERLAGIDPNTHHEIPTLRRSKSYSAAKREALAILSAEEQEPRRKSCDVRGRSSLSDLFVEDDGRRKIVNKNKNKKKVLEDDSLYQVREEEDEHDEKEEEIRVCEGEGSSGVGGIRVRVREKERSKLVVDDDFEGDFKTMKEFIDLEWQTKRQPRRNIEFLRDAASVFSKKLRQWRKKEKKKQPRGSECGTAEAEEEEKEAVGKTRTLGDSKSEVGEYGGVLGRRSCDTDPRLSLDVGQVSMDGGRCCLDEPRASWDGYLVGRSSQHYSRHSMPMVSFLEDVRVIDKGFKDRALVEEKSDVDNPGGSIQTRDYYKDPLSSQRRRRSFDRLSSVRGGGGGSLLEGDELKAISNAKVSPTTVELFYGAKLLITEKELMSSNLMGKGDCREGVCGSKGDDVSESSMVNHSQVTKVQNGWRKALNIWGLLHRPRDSKCVNAHEESFVDGNSDDQVDAETWQVPRRFSSADAETPISQKFNRSYSVSTRNSSKVAGLLNGAGAVESKGIGIKIREEALLNGSRSVKFSSPSNLNNGLLRFHLTPLRTYRGKSVKSRLQRAHYVAKGQDVL